jgi:hypothetical protein
MDFAGAALAWLASRSGPLRITITDVHDFSRCRLAGSGMHLR